MTEKKEKKPSEKRPGPWFENYDYGGPEEASENSPGTGLYSGEMDKYDSVSDFLAKKRKQRRAVRKDAYRKLLGLRVS